MLLALAFTAWIWHPAEVRTKSDRVVKMFGVGAAADGVRHALLAGDVVVGCQQGLDLLGVRRFVAWGGVVIEDRFAARLRHMGLNLREQLVALEGDRIADVQFEGDDLVLHRIDAVDVGDLAGNLILYRNADARAVAVLEHFRYDRHRFLLRVGELRQGSDLLAQQLGGVDRAFRFSRVGGLAGGSQLDAALDRLYMVNAVVVVAKVRLRDALQGRGSRSADCVADSAASETGDGLAVDSKLDSDAQLALLTNADREVRVRGKGKGRCLFRCQVVRHIAHAGLLAAAHDQAEGVVWLDAQLLHALHGVQAQYGRALVVRYAAAVDVAVLFNHIVRVVAPAVALRNNIEVTEQGDLLLPAAISCAARVVIIILGGKAHLLAHLQRLVQHLAAALAVRCLRIVAGLADALDVDQRSDIVDDILSIICNKFVDSGFHLF